MMIEPSQCVYCGRTGTRGFHHMGGGRAMCLSGIACRKRRDSQDAPFRARRCRTRASVK